MTRLHPAHRKSRKPSRAGRTAYTLVEMVVALMAASFLVTGLASSLFLAGQMLTPPPMIESALAGARAASDFVDEMRYAVYVNERTNRAISFAVADRTGDGQPDVLRYSWSGQSGDPLVRTLNGGSAVTVLSDVRAFNLDYTKRVMSESVPVYEESSEQVLAGVTTNASPAEGALSTSLWGGQYFKPSLPAGTLSWKVTRVSLKLRRSGSTDGQFFVQIRPATGSNLPATSVLGEVTFNESALSSSTQTVFANFSTVTNLSPSSGACLVLKHGSGTESCAVRYVSSGLSIPNSALLSTSDQGSLWTAYPTSALETAVYGTYIAPVDPLVISRTYLTCVEVSLQTGDSNQGKVHTTAALVNTPEALSNFWEADFSGNPTALENNYDTTGDWARRDGQAFSTASLANGIWTADSTLDTKPNYDFTTLTTAEVRFRNTSVGGSGAVFSINADWAGGNAIPIYATLQRQSNGTQTLTVYRKSDATTSVALTTVTGLGSGYVDLKLAIHATRNIVGVWIGSTFVSAYAYTPWNVSGNERFASIYASGSNAEFDFVSIRASEPAGAP